MVGLLRDYEKTIEMLKGIDASLKLVIAGNHDISLDDEYYGRKGQYMQRLREPDSDLPARAKQLWTGEDARKAGIVYLEEGTHTFTLMNGAKLRVRFCCRHPQFAQRVTILERIPYLCLDLCLPIYTRVL